MIWGNNALNPLQAIEITKSKDDLSAIPVP